MKKIIFSLAFLALFTMVGLAQNNELFNNLSQQKKIIQLEERIRNYEAELSFIKEKIAQQDNNLIGRLELKNDNLEFQKTQIGWWINILGLLIAFVAIILPVLGSKFIVRYIKQEISEAKEAIEKMRLDAEIASKDITRKHETINLLLNQVPSFAKDMKRNEKDEMVMKLQEIQKQKGATQFEIEMAKAGELIYTNNFDGAISVLKEILFKYKKEMTVEQLILVYYQIAYSFHEQRNFEKAVEYYSKGLSLDDNNFYAYNNRGNAFYSQNNFKMAISDYQKAIQLNPSYPEAYNNLGLAFDKFGDVNNAIESYTTAIQFRPNYADPYYNRGCAFMSKLEYDKALVDFERAIQANPSLIEAYLNRGNTYLKKGEIEKATDNYNKIISINPSFVEAYINRGGVYLQIGELDLALRDFEYALRLKPDSIEARMNRGLVYSDKRDYDLAVRDFDSIIEQNPKMSSSFNNRGLLYYKKGEYEKALTDFNVAIRLDPMYYQAYTNRGLCYHELGNEEEAIKDLNKSIEMNQKSEEAYFHRGLFYIKKADYNKALKDYKKAVVLNPRYSEAYLSVIETLLCVNKLNDVDEYLKTLDGMRLKKVELLIKSFLVAVYSVLKGNSLNTILDFVDNGQLATDQILKVEWTFEELKVALNSDHHLNTPKEKKDEIFEVMKKIEKKYSLSAS